MAKLAELLEVSNEERKAILKHYNMNEDDLNQKIATLKDWYVKSGFPEDDMAEVKARICLLNSKMSVERAKQCLRGYYKMKSLYPSLFALLVTGTEAYAAAKKYSKSVVLPKLSPDLCRVHVMRLSDSNAEAPDAYSYLIIPLLQAEMRIMCENEFFLSNIIVFDFTGYVLKNLLKFNPYINHQLTNMLIALNLRIKSIHLLNLTPVMDKVMLVLKTFLPGKFIDKIVIHNGYDSLYEHIPKENLPSDYGGSLASVDDMHAQWCEALEQEEDYFRKLASIKYHESETTDNYEIFGTGTEGSFKKLAID